MRVLITFRLVEEDDRVHTRHYGIESTELDRLKNDFLTCLNHSTNAPEGGAYQCMDVDTNQARELLLRFDDILYIECISSDPFSEHPSGSLSLGTGPLQSRLATGNMGDL
ncbi:MAG: hypothetical protein M3328_05625 [Chloroflexota bacterium]|nr:hypothetical protein [Chloroflexota bacterium]